MDFNKFITSSPKTEKISDISDNVIKQNDSSSNLIRLTDPYIRRYHLFRISAHALLVSIGCHLIKSTAQNLMGKRLFKFSPWVQLLGGLFYLCWDLQQTFPIVGQDDNSKYVMALTQYRQTHHFNSQYWH